jgi:primosomal protein N' (replication factor Y)
MKYAEVILPLPLENTYTYIVPDELESLVRVHFRVIVPFGGKHYYTAIVRDVHEREPDAPHTLKAISAVLGTAPVLRGRQMMFWEWTASYYICKPGEVYKAAVPAGLKPESETVVAYCDGFEAHGPLSEGEQKVLDALSGRPRWTVAGLKKATGLNRLIPLLTGLMERGAVTVSEEAGREFAAKTETYLRLAPDYCSEESLSPVFDRLQRAEQQEKLLLVYLDLAQPFIPSVSKDVSQKKLLKEAGVSAAVLNALLRRGVLVRYEKAVDPFAASTESLPPKRLLTEAQQVACREIHDAFARKPVCLLHGVPSSGKTEIYLHLAKEALQRGQQVLYLLPEIAVADRLAGRLAEVAGDRLCIYHSGCSDRERVGVWNRLLQSDAPVLVVGIRSALFLPFAGLGLVIVDEEQAPAYKQQDPAPRYHARNAAVMLASMHHAHTLLGSAAPSLESFYNARTGKYGYVALKARHAESPPPRIYLVDVRELRRRKQMKPDTLFSPLLTDAMADALARDEQIILFQNRRGFAPMMECGACSRIVRCTRCDVSLTYHKQQRRLVCHYCGYSIPLPVRCPSCGDNGMKLTGFGTEKVEEEIAALFPGAKAGRLDFDTARTRSAARRILADFERDQTRILIGTQMLSGSFDFERVSIVGILNADSLMNIPDFRAHERAFQLMIQTASHAGRRHRQGTVVIQTSQPGHPLLQMMQTFDYEAMARAQLSERQAFRYPPFFRLITVVLRSSDEDTLTNLSAICAGLLRREAGEQAVYGPFAPPVNRIQTLHVRHIVLKLERAMTQLIRAILEKNTRAMQSIPGFKRIRMHYNVD